MAPLYLDNSLKYMNHPDQALVAKVISAFESVMGRLSKETQMLQLPLIQRAIEMNGVQSVETRHSLALVEDSSLVHLYKKKTASLAMFRLVKGV